MPALPQAAASAFARARTVTYETGEAVSEYDALAIDGGTVRPAVDTDAAAHAVAAADADAGENVTVAVGGEVPARVNSAVVAGDLLDPSADAGMLDAGDGPIYALTDAGDSAGLQHGGALADDLALISL